MDHQPARQALQPGVPAGDLIEIERQVVLRVAADGQVVEIGRQLQIIQCQLGGCRCFDDRQILHAFVQIEQEVIFSQRR